MKSKAVQSLLLALSALLLSWGFHQFNLLEPLENMTWDIRVTYLSDPNDHDPRIKIIMIDQSSLDWAQQSNGLSWPWPREMYRALLDFLHKGGASRAVFDMIYSEPSAYGPSDDDRFAEGLRRIDSVGGVFLSRNSGIHTAWPPMLSKRPEPSSRACQDACYEYATFPTDTLIDAFGTYGSITSSPDRDGIIRHIDLYQTFDGLDVPTLALAAAGKRVGDGRRIIHFHGPAQTYGTINAAAVIQSWLQLQEGLTPQIDPEVFKGSSVFIGVGAPGLMDLKTMPVQTLYPGVEVHATILDNILHDDFFTPAPTSHVIIVLLLLSLFNALGVRYFSTLRTGLLFPLVSIAMILIIATLSYAANQWFPLAILLSGVILSGTLAFGMNYLSEGKERRFIKSAFSRYLSPDVIEALIQNPDNLKLGGERKELTILFSDIQGFTSVSSAMAPEEVAQFLNEYLGLLSDVIMQHGGTIDKFEGDAIIAFWNAPLHQADHADLAVTAALKCQETLKEHSAHFLEKYGNAFKTRIGIHSGEVIVGNLGTDQRFDYTFIGDAGNLAARLESANKFFGTYLMISESTRSMLKKAYHLRYLGAIIVVGRDEPTPIYEVRHDAHDPKYDEAIEAFYKEDLAAARKTFDSLQQDDVVSEKYLGMITAVEQGELLLKEGALHLDSK